jgi:hypothetical protein
MKCFAGIGSIVVLVFIAGCSTTSQVGTGNYANNSGGTSPVVVERLARLQGCDSSEGAKLLTSNGQSGEDYAVKCANGQNLIAHCENQQCKLGAQVFTSVLPVANVGQTTAATYKPAQIETAAPAPVNNVGAPAAVATTSPAPEVVYQVAPHTRLPADPLRFVLGVGAAFGGDTLQTETYTNNSTVNINAGQGGQFYLGLDYRIDENFAVQGTAGYQIVTASASNGTLRFSRYPIELLGYYYLNESWRIGGGTRFVVNPQLIGTGVASETVDFGNSVGAVFEAEYLIGHHFGLKLRAIKESYTQTGTSEKFSGNSAGVYFNFYY